MSRPIFMGKDPKILKNDDGSITHVPDRTEVGECPFCGDEINYDPHFDDIECDNCGEFFETSDL